MPPGRGGVFGEGSRGTVSVVRRFCRAVRGCDVAFPRGPAEGARSSAAPGRIRKSGPRAPLQEKRPRAHTCSSEAELSCPRGRGAAWSGFPVLTSADE
ncbi:hypothetical protein FQA47_000172 [Oryzias melastigma]|uniref:Uncharacterized protein n=1 Tax=Oryzias melastigma TaxID=30732 RepID=A0A834BK94_ORYME|nr:hypothetical protein FQA47_000172 [Oryzias melastigma]